MAFVSPSTDSLALPAPSLVEAGVRNESVAEASFCFIESILIILKLRRVKLLQIEG